MTDQTRWGIDQVQVKNKAVKYQKDLINKAMESVGKMDETSLEELITKIKEKKNERNVV
mgnify:CR=1 FL=1